MIKKGSETKSKPKTKKASEIVENDNIIDIDFSPIKKKRFRLDGDNTRVIELNTSDLNIAIRLEEVYQKLLDLTLRASDKIENLNKQDEENSAATLQLLKDLDTEMRDLINYLFDSDVADKAAPEGSMYDPINGKFRFEYVIERLANLYENNLSKEYELMQKRMNKHTAKYTGKKS